MAPRKKTYKQNHGTRLYDFYSWMEQKKLPAVKKYLIDENHYTEAMMAPSKRLQKKIYDEIINRIEEDDSDVPYRHGDFVYYRRSKKGKDYKIYSRRHHSQRHEKVILDCNQLSKGKNFLAIGLMSISPSQKLLAYTLDFTGFREYDLYITDMITGRTMKKLVQRIRSFAWAGDSQKFFYVTEDSTKRASTVWRSSIADYSNVEQIFQEKDKRFSVNVQLSRSREMIFITSSSATATEVRYLPANNPLGTPKLFKRRRKGVEYFLDHGHDYLYVLSNDSGRNFRLYRERCSAPGRQEELIPHRAKVMIDDVEVFDGHIILHERAEGFPQISMFNLDKGTSINIPMTEGVRSISHGMNLNFATKYYQYIYQSYVTPSSTFQYDVTRNKTRLLKQKKIKNSYRSQDYHTEVVKARAKDGTMIPISLVYKKSLRTNNPQNFFLTGYGAYGYSNDVYFSAARLSLLDRGVIFGTAHVRGGGEFGKTWHNQGRMLSKNNTFTDFIACAEKLFKDRWTTRHQLVIEGGSAGGLLIGCVVNSRPDICKGAVLQVPFVDIMNTMLNEKLPLTTGEYEEWGNPTEEIFYKKMLSYSPYDNIGRNFFPAMLVQTSLNDSQVMYWEPAKYVAKMRYFKKPSGTPLLLKTNMTGGHGGASGRYDAIREVAFTFAFILGVMGLIK